MSKSSKQATWGGRFSKGPAELMLRFSESVSFDQRLALFDLQCSEAHSAMLEEVGILSASEKEAIHTGLATLRSEIESGEFAWDMSLEDVHMNIEQVLTERVPEAAKLHTARSRNDQVATDMRLFFKAACSELQSALEAVLSALLDQAEKNQQIYIPGYTHLQRAQPVSVAHHLLAYAEMISRDLIRVAAVQDQANWCPLGSGAIAGTTLPIDRESSAQKLGFVDQDGHVRVTQNSMDAVSDRDVHLDFTYACSVVGIHLSRLAEDLILWCSSEFGFVDLPQNFCTGSSLMPQKKNPDAMELVRGKSGRVVGDLQTLLTMVKGLPLTYNRDLQEDKPPVFDALEQSLISLQVVEGVVSGMEMIHDKCAEAVADPALLATDVVDYLVQKGVPFRNAHHIIGALVALAEEKSLPLNELSLQDVQGVDEHFEADWVDCFDVVKALEAREKVGMPGPNEVKSQIVRLRGKLA
ncbi:argininosuccinate lyase [Opitutia bacterium ISCC 51]|nr:argininosuccinate lyase [Opitutae bacterium ISCC 51]QXD28268.1 argininosuccinate lyase [Opitutae bacterium ISCC 52]